MLNFLIEGGGPLNGFRTEQEFAGARPFGELHDIDTGVRDPPPCEPFRHDGLRIGYGLRRRQTDAVQHFLELEDGFEPHGFQ